MPMSLEASALSIYLLAAFAGSLIGGLPAPPPVRPEGKCPQDWYQYEKNCYKIFGDTPSDRLSWNDARGKCKSLGAGYELASIHSMGEQMFLTALIPYHKDHLWIGMYSETGGFDLFKWSDGSNITFNYWMPHLLRAYWSNTCAWLSSDFYSAGRWNRTFCNREGNHGYICKTQTVPGITPGHNSSLCKDKNFIEYNGACYSLFNDKRTWDDAESTCSKLGGHLSSINSPYEQAFIYNYINGTIQVWLGFRDDKGYGLYQWTDKWPVLYTSWNEGEPNIEHEGQTRCVSFDPTTKRWNSTANCTQLYSFICKKNEQTPPNITYDKYNGKCPSHLKPRFDYGGRYCYHVGLISWKSWGDAAMYCLQNGANLATFSSPSQLRMLWPQLGDVTYQLWIGLIKKYDGHFGWIDGSPLNFTSWYPTTFPQGNCTYMETTDMKWRQDKCMGGFYFYAPLCMTKKDPL